MTVTGSGNNRPRCPYNQGQSYIDTNGVVYVIVCEAALMGEVIETSSQRGFMDCMTACDSYNIGKGSSNLPDCGGINHNNATSIANCQLTEGNDIGPSPGIWSGRLISRAVVTATGPGAGYVLTSLGYESVTDMAAELEPVRDQRPTLFRQRRAMGKSCSTKTVVTSIVLTHHFSRPGTGARATQYVPGSTIYGVSTAYQTAVSSGITYTSIYGVTTAISVVYSTVTTTTVSISIQPTTVRETIHNTVTSE